MKKLFITWMFLVMAVPTPAQRKYLVSPNDEVIPLRRGESSSSIIAKRTGRQTQSTGLLCGGNRFTFGYPEDKYPPNQNFGSHHKDVVGEWFIAKAGGTIDTLFWEALGSVGAKDSTLYLRINNSRIGPGYGPGIYNDSSSWPPPCQNWGYFINTNDLDQGIAAYPEDATPPGPSTWTSTIAKGPATKPPFTETLTGWLGFGITNHAGKINSLALINGGSNLDVSIGQKFFLSFRIKGPAGHTNDARTEWAASGFRVDKNDENYPSRLWKFYEHDSGPSNCGGIPTSMVKRGWVARGGFANDSLDVAALNIWYSMVVTSNAPPDVQSTTVLHTTFSSAPQTVDAEILDCDPALPSRAGVKKAILKWQINDVPQPDIDMFPVGGLTWEADLPSAPPGSLIQYKVYAEDSTGLSGSGIPITYRILSVHPEYARIDTTSPCIPKSIAGNPANAISPGQFFLPPGSPMGHLPTDDGTAGPFDMGSPMPLFGDVGRYMWIGVNGGVAISKNATDTVDVNAAGSFPDWSIPSPDPLRRGGRSDTAYGLGRLRMPGNFFAPLWSNLWLGDSVGGTICGHIRFQRGYAGDTCVVIVEWDSIGTVSFKGTQACDDLTFRAIFNKCDGSIEYQYDDIGTAGEDSLAVIGFQADSTSLTVPNPLVNSQSPFFLLNESGFPSETRPRSGWCVKMYQCTIKPASSGWNLVCICGDCIDCHKTTLFPTALSPAFAYNGTYQQRAILEPGVGYWMKFAGGQNIGSCGPLRKCVVDTIRVGWNIICGPDFPVSSFSIIHGGGVVLTSAFYEYNGTYHTTFTLRPGYAYWIRASAPGILTICGGGPVAEPRNAPSTNFASLNSITVTDNSGRKQVLYLGAETSLKDALGTYELPPAAPEFDARFGSQRMVETYPALLDEKAVYEYPINIATEAYPLTVSWNTVSTPERKIVLTSADGKLGKTVLDGTGRVKISDENVKRIVITLSDIDLPKVYSLGQNYPNPFNPSTTFNVDIPRVSDVSIKVYDVLGREITTLLSGQQPAGTMQLTWDGRDGRGLTAPTGIYFVKMSAGEFSESRKVMLMK